MNDILTLENIGKSYRDGEKVITVLNGITFSLQKGDFYSIQGPSGSGKSTLLNLIGALSYPDTGDIFVEGKNITDYYQSGSIHEYRLKHIGFVFQNHLLMPDFTLEENVMMPLLISGVSRSQAKQRAAEIIEKVGLSDRKSHFPSQISGGESQRAAVARAVITRPSIILADEPTGNLDKKNSEKFIELLLELSKKENLTILAVTHDQNLAKSAKKRFTLTDGTLKKIS